LISHQNGFCSTSHGKTRDFVVLSRVWVPRCFGRSPISFPLDSCVSPDLKKSAGTRITSLAFAHMRSILKCTQSTSAFQGTNTTFHVTFPFSSFNYMMSLRVLYRLLDIWPPIAFFWYFRLLFSLNG